ncbi:hypothetical protein SDC9_163660 [bioreactor metagenome]|uniref:HD domain-containing protein n=1 Tax=bioreactor metagenome TaxID=1076179 RepID=A0A645FPH5_9ZZZZ|nr:HD domain-containing protein [Oscillospiraceae bacterium]
MGYTEHSFPHVIKAAEESSEILKALGYDERTCELARIAGYMHDLGNVVNRDGHAQTGACMAFRILEKLGMSPEETAEVVSAIGNHDESTATTVSPIAAALIIADKSDVRRSRVRAKNDLLHFDIHDRVNYAVYHSDLSVDTEKMTVTLKLNIDTSNCPVIDYFEIFLNRMTLCRKSAHYLGLRFRLIINDAEII